MFRAFRVFRVFRVAIRHDGVCKHVRKCELTVNTRKPKVGHAGLGVNVSETVCAIVCEIHSNRQAAMRPRATAHATAAAGPAAPRVP